MNLLGLLIENVLISLYQVVQIVTTFPMGDYSLAQSVTTFDDYSEASQLASYLKIIAFVVTIIAGFVLIRMWMKLEAMRKKAQPQPQIGVEALPQTGPKESKWQDIMRHVESITEAEWKFAVIEADQLVDEVLKSRFPGDTMGERMMNIDKTSLLSIDGLWEAHKVRNRLAHDSNYFLRHAEAFRAIKLYEATLKELGVIN
ncbi:hypothetical protein KW791_01560 [Candidatus Parcubacteria bacterium]|nr:hypothetical protein [Candidatus Parcubacteria bacterium]